VPERARLEALGELVDMGSVVVEGVLVLDLVPEPNPLNSGISSAIVCCGCGALESIGPPDEEGGVIGGGVEL
jgi:hypothetical protein